MKSFAKVLSLFFGIIFVFGLIFYLNSVQTVAAPFDDCLYDSDCEEGERCVGADDESDSYGVCETVEPERERSEIGGSCSSNSDCESGLVCRSGTCDRGTGDDPDDHEGEGAVCTDDGDCASGLECIGGSCIARTGRGADCTDNADCSEGLICNRNGVCTVEGDAESGSDSGSSSRSDYGLDDVPDQLRDIGEGDLINIVLRIIQYVVGLVGIILLIMFIYGGITYMTAAGNEEQAGKAKKILTYAVIGIIIVAFSFAIAEFVVRALSGGSSGSDGDSAGSGTDSSGTRLPGDDEESEGDEESE